MKDNQVLVINVYAPNWKDQLKDALDCGFKRFAVMPFFFHPAQNAVFGGDIILVRKVSDHSAKDR